MPSRGSLICISIVAETIWRMRTASLRARAGSAIADLLNQGVVGDAGADIGGPLQGPAASVRVVGGRGSLIGVAEELTMRREQRHLRPPGQQPLAGIEDVGDLPGVPGDGGDPDPRTSVQVLVADLRGGHDEATPQL